MKDKMTKNICPFCVTPCNNEHCPHYTHVFVVPTRHKLQPNFDGLYVENGILHYFNSGDIIEINDDTVLYTRTDKLDIMKKSDNEN